MLRRAGRKGNLRHVLGKHIKRNPVGDRLRELRVEQILQEGDGMACSILDPDHPDPPEGGIRRRPEVVVEQLWVGSSVLRRNERKAIGKRPCSARVRARAC